MRSDRRTELAAFAEEHAEAQLALGFVMGVFTPHLLPIPPSYNPLASFPAASKPCR